MNISHNCIVNLLKKRDSDLTDISITYTIKAMFLHGFNCMASGHLIYSVK